MSDAAAIKPYYEREGVALYHGECLDVMARLSDASIDAVICDPPYPYIVREYGAWDESSWRDMMDAVVIQVRRLLKPQGSAVFVVQPNSEKVGRMRGWLWRWLADLTETWNVVQDAYWWRFDAQPTGGSNTHGLLRASVKPCVWCGPPGCYRSQGSVLWEESQANAAERAAGRMARSAAPSGWRQGAPRETNGETIRGAAERRGGVTPFNLLPVANGDSRSSAGSHGHGAGTPLALCDWWTRYICPPGGTVLDPFMGSGTTGVAALKNGRRYVGVERVEKYCEVAAARLDAARITTDAEGGLFA